MSAIDELRDDVGEIGFALEVAGLQYRYYSVGDPAASNLSAAMPDTGGVATYINVPLLDDVGSIESQLDPGGGIAEYKPIEITLTTQTLYADQEGDPGRVFGRLGRRSVGLIAYLAESASQTQNRIYVDRDLSGLSYPRLMQLGGETLWVTAAASVAPWDIIATRGVAGTVPQIHEVNAAAGDLPELLPEVAAWQTRRAVLYACRIRPDGSASDYIEIMRGFLDDTPTPDGDLVRVSLVPLPGLLGSELESPRKPTGLLHGWHYFEPPYGTTLEMGQAFFGGDGAFVGTVAATGVGPVRAEYTQGANWLNIFDTTLPTGHPRRGRLDVEGPSDVEIDSTAAGGAGVELRLAVGATLPAPGVWPDPGTNSTVVEVHRIDLLDPADPAEVMAWPDAALDAISSAAGWMPGVHTGLTGQWMDVNLDEGAGAPGLEVTYNTPHHHRSAFLYLWSDFTACPPAVQQLGRVWEAGDPEAPAGPYRHLWYGIDLADPESGIYPSTQQGAARPQAARHWVRGIRVEGRAGERVPVRGIALAYYQTGESHVLVEDDVFVAPGSRTSIEVSYYDWQAGETNRAVARITASTAVTHPTTGLTIGYRLTIADEDRRRLPSFGDWPGRGESPPPPRVTITPIVRWTAQPAERLLLELLTSAGGEQANGADDVLPFGAEAHHEDVDAASFARWSPPPGLELWSQRFEDGMSVADVLKWPLIVTNTALVMRRDEQGRSRLTRVGVGVESRGSAVGTITQADIIEASWGRNDQIYNLHELQFDWSEEDDKPRSTVKWHDKRSQRAYRQVKARKYPLRGLRLPDIAAGAAGNVDAIVRPLVSRQRVIYGDPRRTLTLTVSRGLGMLAQIGATYLVTHPELRGYGDAWGIVDQPMRLLAVRENDDGTAVLSGEIYGVDATGYNAAATVASVPAADAVITLANVDADEEHPDSGQAQLDCDGFAAGDKVVYRPPGDHDNAVSLTVLSVDRATRRVTFTAGHGITPHGARPAGGTIEPNAYPLQTPAHRALANLSDAAGTLGATPDDGYDLA